MRIEGEIEQENLKALFDLLINRKMQVTTYGGNIVVTGQLKTVIDTGHPYIVLKTSNAFPCNIYTENIYSVNIHERELK